MKASIKFRDEQKPLLRAKLPLNVLNFPLQSGVSAGESKELTLNLATFFDSGPSIKLSYRPNDSQNPFGLVFKTGIGSFGSPAKSPLIMSAEFNLVGNCQNPSFFIKFKPNFGDFSLQKLHSSGFVKGFGDKEKLNGEGGNLGNGYFHGNGYSFESKAMVDGVLRGAEISAKTKLPVRDFAVVNCGWGLRFPEGAEMGDAVMVAKKGEWGSGMRMPVLVMNKIGIEHVANVGSKKEKVGKYEDVTEACLEVKKKLDVIQAENGLLSKALSDLRSDIAAGRMDVFGDRRVGLDRKCFEGKGHGGKSVMSVEGGEELKV